MNLACSIATVGGFTLLSRVLGLVRDILIAAILGAGLVADSFFVAFKFPNLFRRLFAEGAFNLAFVPIYAGLLEEDGKDAAKEFADQALAALLWALLILVVVIEIAMPWVMMASAPGFVGNPHKFQLAIDLTRITFPYLLFISLVSLMAGVLNSLGRFAAAAATPILLNICLIGAVLGLSQVMETPGHALASGVFAAGVVQFAWLYFHCGRAGVWLRLPWPRLTQNVRLLIRRALPVAVGAGIYQINLLIDTVIASLLPDGSISYLFFADRVNQLPLGVVGVAVGTALLPLMSRQIRAGDESAAQHSQNRALEFSLLLTLPAAAALVVIAGPVISVLFERGTFGAGEAQATAQALALYATGLPAYVLVKTLAPGYFARGDTATPVKIAAAAMAINLVLNLILMGPFQHVGIAMATSVSAWINAGLLAMVLRRRGQLEVDRRLSGRLPRVLLATAGMAALLAVAQGGLEGALASELATRVAALTGLVAGGIAVFAVFAVVFGAARIDDLKVLGRKDAA